jgi:hypothetical protein
VEELAHHVAGHRPDASGKSSATLERVLGAEWELILHHLVPSDGVAAPNVSKPLVCYGRYRILPQLWQVMGSGLERAR